MGSTFRDLLTADELLVVVECHDVLTARMVEQQGIRATYIGGQTMGALYAGIPDHGLVAMHEMVEHTARIAASISIPLIVDADQGGETAMNVRRTVRDFEHAGAAAIHIEDTKNPKHLFKGDELVSVDVMRSRIAAAVNARRSDDFVVIARSDERVNKGTIEETIRRGCAYAAEGADAFMVPVIGRVDDIKAVVEAVPIPVIDINQPLDRARDGGLAADMFAGITLAGVVRAQQQLLDEVAQNGRVDLRAHIIDPDALAALVHEPDFLAAGDRWASALRG